MPTTRASAASVPPHVQRLHDQPDRIDDERGQRRPITLYGCTLHSDDTYVKSQTEHRTAAMARYDDSRKHFEVRSRTRCSRPNEPSAWPAKIIRAL